MAETGVATITSKGQITVPKGIREALGADAGDQLVFEVDGSRASVRKAPKESLAELFHRQKPWKANAVAFQRKLRDEWTSRTP
jgi:AbrB family looped-hinge helix DNA binding protein